MRSYSFTEQTSREAGFGKVFHKRIVPILEDYEDIRVRFRQKMIVRMALFTIAAIGVLLLGQYLGETRWSIIAAGAVAAGIWVTYSYYSGYWRAGLGKEIIPILCTFLGGMAYGRQRIELYPFQNLGVLPAHNKSVLQDPVNGTHAEIEWRMSDVRLERTVLSGRGYNLKRKVFRGLLFMIAINGPAPRIFFGKDRGGALNWLSETFSSSRQGLDKLEMNDPEFEKVYETYSSDANAARRFIDPNLRAGLLEVAQVEGGKKYISCAMEGDWMYLALPRSGDFLGLGSLFSPLTAIEGDLHEALADLDMPARVIDRLKGN